MTTHHTDPLSQPTYQYRLSHWTRSVLPLDDRETRNYPIRNGGTTAPLPVSQWLRRTLRRFGRPRTR